MKFRPILFWAHLIAGISVGSVLFIMAVTGAILSFAPQLEEISEKKIRYAAPAEKRLSYKELITKTSETFPKVPASGLIIKSNPASSIVIQFGREKSFYVNPYTGEVLGGASKTHQFMHFVEDLHRRLALAARGEVVTKACNVVFLFMILSGLYLWWPRNWHPMSLKAIFFFNPKLSGKARDWNWHNVVGFWSLPFMLIVVLTGLIMSYQWSNAVFFKLMGSEPPPQMQKGPGGVGGKGSAPAIISDFNWDAYITSAAEKVPQWKSMMLRLPPKPDAPVSILIQGAGGPHFARSQMALDIKTAKVVKWEPFLELNKARQGRVWVRYLHTGEAWGLISQIAAFFTSCAAILLIWTGFSMAWFRFAGKKNKNIRTGERYV